MFVILKHGCNTDDVASLSAHIFSCGAKPEYKQEDNLLIIRGDLRSIDADALMAFACVSSVYRQAPQYPLVAREGVEESIINVNTFKVGGGNFALIAGPCTVENEEQTLRVAQEVKKNGATMLRGGAFKPRTSPYAFQGLGEEGIKILLKAKKQTGLPIVSEILDVRHLDMYADVDVIQVGARNMHNYELLKELGRSDKPVLLKRGLASSIEEWLLSAEYVMKGGNNKVILCERGIKTFEPSERGTLDLASIAQVKEKTHLPVVVDPSHAAGRSRFVSPLALASVAVGADGVMIEVHDSPSSALCDGAQALDFESFNALAEKIKLMLPLINKR